jgi:hypothetical protein
MKTHGNYPGTLCPRDVLPGDEIGMKYGGLWIVKDWSISPQSGAIRINNGAREIGAVGRGFADEVIHVKREGQDMPFWTWEEHCRHYGLRF